ncbi:hypothetical protein D3C76_1832130 [compost metagenome]
MHIRAFSLLSHEHLVPHRIVDYADRQLPAYGKGDRYGIERKAVYIVGRSVNRVDDP